MYNVQSLDDYESSKSTKTSTSDPYCKKFVRICVFDKHNFFDMGNKSSSCATSWFIACDDDVNVIRISRESFLGIHKHSRFLLSQLMENYKLAVPDLEQCSILYREKLISDYYENKHTRKSLKPVNDVKVLKCRWFH